MRDLTQHLTTRADDNHAPPVSSAPKRGPALPGLSEGCQALVSPLLVRVPVNSFEFYTCVRTPQAEHLMRLLRHRTLMSPTPSAHRLRRGLPGYLILFATHAFVPQCQLLSRRPPSPLVFLLISTHFTATLGIPPSPPALKLCSSQGERRLGRRLKPYAYRATYVLFTPSNSG